LILTVTLRTFKSNIEGTWNILDLCKNSEIPIIAASSDKAYGYTDSLPYNESHELNAIYPYEVSKAIGDKLSQSYIETFNISVTTLRCGNVYGGGDLNWDRLIPGVIRSLLKNQAPTLRTNGDFTRDWVYVGDIVNAYVCVAEEVLSKKSIFHHFIIFLVKNIFRFRNIQRIVPNSEKRICRTKL